MEDREFGLKRKIDEDEIYNGIPVRINFPNKSYMGVVDEIHETYFFLRPTIIDESLVNPDGTKKSFARLEKKIPFKVTRSPSIEGIEPLSEGYLERFVDSINSQYPKSFFIKIPDNSKSSQ